MNKASSRPWPIPYKELTDAMYALRRHFRTPVILACSAVHPRHSLPKEQLQVLADVAAERTVVLPSLSSIVKKSALCVLAAIYDTAVLTVLAVFWTKHVRRFRQRVRPRVILRTWVP